MNKLAMITLMGTLSLTAIDAQAYKLINDHLCGYAAVYWNSDAGTNALLLEDTPEFELPTCALTEMVDTYMGVPVWAVVTNDGVYLYHDEQCTREIKSYRKGYSFGKYITKSGKYDCILRFDRTERDEPEPVAIRKDRKILHATQDGVMAMRVIMQHFSKEGK